MSCDFRFRTKEVFQREVKPYKKNMADNGKPTEEVEYILDVKI
jgi:hypothetical protein|tara:strand:- start:235 stop:363 length:129 start_codon:yes stop_codon:yes gene_type:complete